MCSVEPRSCVWQRRGREGEGHAAAHSLELCLPPNDGIRQGSTLSTDHSLSSPAHSPPRNRPQTRQRPRPGSAARPRRRGPTGCARLQPTMNRRGRAGGGRSREHSCRALVPPAVLPIESIPRHSHMPPHQLTTASVTFLCRWGDTGTTLRCCSMPLRRSSSCAVDGGGRRGGGRSDGASDCSAASSMRWGGGEGRLESRGPAGASGSECRHLAAASSGVRHAAAALPSHLHSLQAAAHDQAVLPGCGPSEGSSGSPPKAVDHMSCAQACGSAGRVALD